jgi:hypothetical protein
MIRMLLLGAMLAGAIVSGDLVPVHAGDPAPEDRSLPEQLKSVYVVAQYDDSRDPSKALAAATARAQRDQKRIILEVGRRRCAWCQALDAFIRRSDVVTDELRSNYLILKVPDSLEQPIFEFLADYPTVYETPHWFVLESDGKLLHSQNASKFESGGTYRESKLVEFLQTWKRKEGVFPSTVR